MVYQVRDILEDVDFGCEERPEGAPVLAIAVLEGEDGSLTQIKMPDLLFDERRIKEGDRVCLDEAGLLKKIPGIDLSVMGAIRP